MKIVMRLALLMPLVLVAACQQGAPAPEASQTAETALPEVKQGITASDGKLVLPAVKGRPGAAYFMISNSDTKGVELTGVAIAGAGKAEMHETTGGEMTPLPKVELGAGDMVLFERGGKHVMVFDLDPKIKAGGTAEMTLKFADGGKVSLPLAVETAGGDDGKDHGAMH